MTKNDGYLSSSDQPDICSQKARLQQWIQELFANFCDRKPL
ncbi:hypothetical protein BPUTSESOX_568 [uncultured Gammaproteobacteria bacterium]|nr:hypothetical protein BPUTSESOX_568 [uncultured Gammaproteobacteria bacterium]